MASPKFRKKVSLSAGMKNQGLKDILTPTHGGVTVESVEAIQAPLHNTKIVIIREKDAEDNNIAEKLRERRSILYNRVDLSTLLEPGTTLTSTTLPAIINELNLKYSCDFTEDDLELVDGVIRAKEQSLGYYGKLDSGGETGGGEEEDFCANATPQARIFPGLPYSTDDGDIVSSWDLYYNGELQNKAISYDYQLIQWVQENLLGQVSASWANVNEMTPDSGGEVYQNYSDKCLRFELRPKNTFGAIDEFNEMTGNPSFNSKADGTISFNLAPFVSACSLQYAKKLSLLPKDYGFKNFSKIRMHYIVEQDGAELTRDYMNWDTEWLYADEFYHAPNVPALNLPNNISSQFPTVKNICEFVKERLGSYVNVSFSIPVVKQLSPVVKTAYLGVASDWNGAGGLIYGKEGTYGINLLRTDADGKQTTLELGETTFTPTSASDAISKLKAFFKPRLESLGFTVTNFSIAGTSFSSSDVLKLEITTTDKSVSLFLTGTYGVWDPAFTDWRGTACNFMDTAVVGPLVTEEDYRDKVIFDIRPFEPLEEDEVNDFKQNSNIRVKFVSAEEFGEPLPADTYDWIAQNFNGQTQIIDSCSIQRPGRE